jgi:endonuclease/exonuclease/phosphatase family metal-dependent hydrolase
MLRRLLLATALLVAGAVPADALRVTSWNLLDYPNLSFSTRQPHFRTVMQALDTDVLVVQEIKSAAGADSFLAVLKSVHPSRGWKGGAGLFLGSCESALFYDSLKVTHANNVALGTAGPRDVQVVLIRPNGYASAASRFRLYSAHLKAGNPSTSPADSATRRAECVDLRNHMNAAPAGQHMILGGDMNFYGAWEGGYIRLTESQADNDGRMQDPITMSAVWQSATNAIHHTQCPCIGAGCGTGFSGGGMDDRFDMLLGTTNLFDGEGLDVVPGPLPDGYGAFGNDGFHYNTDIDGGNFNFAVGLPVAQALRLASDHLPVVMTLQLPARVSAPHALAFGDAIVGGVATADLAVGNATAPPGDELDYTLVAPVGFTIAGGPHQASAGAAATVHPVTMLTLTPGLKSGALVVASDDLDSTAKAVQLSGRVLTHAEASLDSLVALTTTLLDLGEHPAGGFTEATVRVHNLGFDPLQARLQTQSATVTGGDGRFALVGGFTPALLAGTGQPLTVQFDDTGATTDSTYEATLTVASADEPLPGATAQPDLVVTLQARVASGGLAAGDRVTAFALHAPTPNPLRRATTLAFDLPRAAELAITIHDLSGRRVATLASGAWPAGRHSLGWDAADDAGRGVAAGLYFVRMEADGFARVARVAVLP